MFGWDDSKPGPQPPIARSDDKYVSIQAVAAECENHDKESNAGNSASMIEKDTIEEIRIGGRPSDTRAAMNIPSQKPQRVPESFGKIKEALGRSWEKLKGKML